MRFALRVRRSRAPQGPNELDVVNKAWVGWFLLIDSNNGYCVVYYVFIYHPHHRTDGACGLAVTRRAMEQQPTAG